MAIARTSPSSVGIGTALNSLANGSAMQTDVVTSGTSNNLIDIVARWVIVLGTITASVNTRIDVYVWGSNHDTEYPGGSSSIEVITGTAGSIGLSGNGLITVRHLRTTAATTSAITLKDEESIVRVLGYIPRRWGLVIANNTGAALASSGHSINYSETYY